MHGQAHAPHSESLPVMIRGLFLCPGVISFIPVSFSYLTAAKPDSPKLASSYETLKLTARKEQLCLLNRHFSLHQLGLAGNCAPADRDGSFPSHLLRAKDGEGRMRPPDDWDDRAALLKLPAAVVYMRDQHLEGKLHLLKHRERLQHLLLHQRQQSQRARAESDPKSAPEERPLSPWPSITGGCKEERSFLEDAVDGKEEKELWLSRDGSEQREKAEAGRDYGVDVPLDLSDAGRGREAGWRDCREPREAGSPQPSPRGSPMHVPCGRHGTERDGSRPPSSWPSTARAPLAEQHGATKEEEEEEQEEEAMVSTRRVGNSRGSFPAVGSPVLGVSIITPTGNVPF